MIASKKQVKEKKHQCSAVGDIPVIRARVAERGDDRFSRDVLLFTQMGHWLKQLCTHKHMKQREEVIVHVQQWLSRGQKQSKPACGQQHYAQHKAAVVACLIVWLHEGRKKKMQWVPSCCLTLLLLMLQIKMIYTSNIVQNDDPHKTELHTRGGHGIGSLCAPGGAIGIGKSKEQYPPNWGASTYGLWTETRAAVFSHMLDKQNFMSTKGFAIIIHFHMYGKKNKKGPHQTQFLLVS